MISVDDLVGEVEQSGRHLQPHRLRGTEIDDELEFVRLLDRDICRLGATKDLDEQPRALPNDLNKARAVAGKTARLRNLGPLVDCRQLERASALADQLLVR